MGHLWHLRIVTCRIYLGEVLLTGTNCPEWGNAGAYEDCELCPTFNECMIQSSRERTNEA